MTLANWAENRWLRLHRTIQTLPLIMGSEKKDDADYLNACRSKRNIAEYDRSGVVSEGEAGELPEFTAQRRDEVLDWLRQNHPSLL